MKIRKNKEWDILLKSFHLTFKQEYFYKFSLFLKLSQYEKYS